MGAMQLKTGNALPLAQDVADNLRASQASYPRISMARETDRSIVL